jgi:glycerol-3-phosphate acyltransferase PlsY
MLALLITGLVSYLIGSIPAGYIVDFLAELNRMPEGQHRRDNATRT